MSSPISLVVEALLCAAGDYNEVSLDTAISDIGCDADFARSVVDFSYHDWPVGTVRFGDRMARAAYSLIEGSPELRREWFGAK